MSKFMGQDQIYTQKKIHSLKYLYYCIKYENKSNPFYSIVEKYKD